MAKPARRTVTATPSLRTSVGIRPGCDYAFSAVAAHGVPVLGFHQHTDPESKRIAEEAGVAIVVPRSRLMREMPELVDGLLT